MKDIISVRTELAEVFKQLKNGEIKPAYAAELSNCAGKIINSLKVELKYYAARKETPEIDFFTKANAA